MNPYVGEIRLFPWNFAPRGWHLCDGTILTIQSNAALFSLLGTQYGGNGSTSFALPDLRGRTSIHFSPNYTQGEPVGTETVLLNISEMPMHAHTLMETSQAGATPQPNGRVLAKVSAAADPHYAPDTTTVGLNPTSVQTSGGNQPHANMQPFLVLNYCIATSGVFPARN